MASRRDELQAHRFLKQRVVGGLVIHDTDPERPPFRRATVATYGSIALALLALAAAGVYGLFVPVHGHPFTPGKDIIVEQETGTRFVYLNGRLNPVSNYSSARLIAGPDAATKSVHRSSLVGIPRGPEVGIAGAPDELPDPDHLLRGSWTLCSQPRTDGSGDRVEDSVLLVGRPPGGGAPARSTAVLMDVPATGRHFLLWHGYRHQITDPTAVSAGLALAQETRIAVSPTLADVLPAGAAIAPLAVPHAGAVSRALPSRPQIRTGQLFVVRVSGAVQQYYLAQADRLMPITPFQFDIQLAAPATKRAYPASRPRAIALDPAEVTLAGQAPASDSPSGPPRTRPAFVRPSPARAAVCGTFAPGAAVPTVTVGATLPGAKESLATNGPSQAPRVDRIVVPAGRAALVTAVQDDGSRAGTVSLVTDQGKRFSLVSTDVVKTLGFGDATPIRMPAGLVARIPAGPALDPDGARRPSH